MEIKTEQICSFKEILSLSWGTWRWLTKLSRIYIHLTCQAPVVGESCGEVMEMEWTVGAITEPLHCIYTVTSDKPHHIFSTGDFWSYLSYLKPIRFKWNRLTRWHKLHYKTEHINYSEHVWQALICWVCVGTQRQTKVQRCSTRQPGYNTWGSRNLFPSSSPLHHQTLLCVLTNPGGRQQQTKCIYCINMLYLVISVRVSKIQIFN